MKKSLSLCMIARDAEDTLAESLKSVSGCVDEIIVVDTGSNDSTRYIASDYGAKVYNFRWNDDFAEARNFALSKVETDWVLILDADEVLVDATREKLELLMNKPTDKIPVYFMDIFTGTEPGKRKKFRYFQRKPRLFPNNGFQFEYSINEQLYHPNGAEDLTGLFAKGMAVKQYLKGGLKSKSKRNVNILKKELQKFPDSFYYNYLMGKECLLHGFDSKAVISYNRAIRSNEEKEEFYLSEISTDIIKILYKQRDTHEALNECIRRQKLCALNPEYWLTYGFIAIREGDFECARDCLKKCLETPPPANYLLVNIENITWKPELLLGYAYLREKDFLNARKHFQNALNHNQDEWILLFYLSIACRGLKDYNAAEAYLTATEMLAPEENRQDIKLNFLLNYIMGGQFEKANELIKELIQEYGMEEEELSLLEYDGMF